MKLYAPPAEAARMAVPRKSGGAWAKLGPRDGEIVEWGLFWLFVAGLAWCPFWYGSNDLVAWGVNAILFPGLAVIYEILTVVRGKRHPVALRELWLPALLFVAVLIWVVVQNATWTPATWHHPIWELAGEALQKSLPGSISVNRDLSIMGFVRLITAASVFWLSVQLCRNATRAMYLIYAIAFIVTGYAAYGLFDFAMTATIGQFVTSTFVNRSHFSTYAGIGFVVIIAMILRIYRHEVAGIRGPVSYRVAEFIDVSARKAGLLLSAAVLVLISLFLTASRGGLLSTGLGLFTLIMLASGSQKGQTAKTRLTTLGVGVLLVAIALVVFGDRFVRKIADQGLADESRVAMYVIMLRSIWDAPLFGYGYDTFIDVFPMFRDRSLNVAGIWEHAHNTYLEIFQGLGVVFGSMLVASVVFLVVRCFQGAMRRQESVTVPLVAASVAMLVGIHALADFSLEIQAVTITFMALLGAGVAQSKSSRLQTGD